MFYNLDYFEDYGLDYADFLRRNSPTRRPTYGLTLPLALSGIYGYTYPNRYMPLADPVIQPAGLLLYRQIPKPSVQSQPARRLRVSPARQRQMILSDMRVAGKIDNHSYMKIMECLEVKARREVLFAKGRGGGDHRTARGPRRKLEC